MTERTAACPNCGAEIVFRWSGAVQTSCPACRSVLVRLDLEHERVGTIGDVPPSMSRIQLGTEGSYKGKAFVVVGRIIYEYERGHWSEWHIRLSDGTSAWLSDAQAEYAITRQVENPGPLPAADTCRPGQAVALDGATYRVSVVTHALYSGVEGELPFEYWDKLHVEFVDLKGPGEQFATIDYSEPTPLLLAASKGDLALVNRLLKSGANPNVKNKLNTTPLLEAAFSHLPAFCADIPPLRELGLDDAVFFSPDADPAKVARFAILRSPNLAGHVDGKATTGCRLTPATHPK